MNTYLGIGHVRIIEKEEEKEESRKGRAGGAGGREGGGEGCFHFQSGRGERPHSHHVF